MPDILSSVRGKPRMATIDYYRLALIRVCFATQVLNPAIRDFSNAVPAALQICPPLLHATRVATITVSRDHVDRIIPVDLNSVKLITRN